MIKVSDFGLTEDVYARNYFRQGREDGVVKLPVKWMSPESLNDGVFTEKTDVVCTYLEVERCTMFSLISLVSRPELELCTWVGHKQCCSGSKCWVGVGHLWACSLRKIWIV